MKDYHLKQLEDFIQEHPSVAKKIISEKYGQALELYELRDLNNEEAIELYYEIKDAVAIESSRYSQKKIANAIQMSRSGIGFCAMTKFTCSFCGKEELWGNTSVPHICSDCASDMAKNIILLGYDLLKDGGDNNEEVRA